MSLQDDIFDIEDALKGKPEAEGFRRIVRALANFEEENDNLEKVFAALKRGAEAVKYLLTEGETDANDTN